MKVFISYDRDDEAVAHLLTYILSAHGIQCEIDRQLPASEPFNANIQSMIKSADLMLVLLTKSAVTSTWVNQEIGFAVAHGKSVWPIAIETDIKPHGMLNTVQSYSLFDWSNPSNSIERLIGTLRKAGRDNTSPFETFGLNHRIHGKVERSKFLIKRFRELQNQDDRKLVILTQGAFSIFAASDDPMFREVAGYSDYEVELFLEERKALSDLLNRDNVELKVIVWPVREYEAKYLELRYKNLLNWMHQTKSNPRVSYRCAKYLGSNRVIVVGQLCVEGFKHHPLPGFDMTDVKYELSEIEQATRDFFITFNSSHQDKDSTICRIEEMYAKLTQPG
jgi:hypothetical protein